MPRNPVKGIIPDKTWRHISGIGWHLAHNIFQVSMAAVFFNERCTITHPIEASSFKSPYEHSVCFPLKVLSLICLSWVSSFLYGPAFDCFLQPAKNQGFRIIRLCHLSFKYPAAPFTTKLLVYPRHSSLELSRSF